MIMLDPLAKFRSATFRNNLGTIFIYVLVAYL